MIDNASSFCPVRLFCCGPNPSLCETFFHSPFWLDKPARLSFSCSLDLLLISDQTNTCIEISETATGCLQLVRLQRFNHSAAEHNFCSKQLYGEQPPFLKWFMYTIQESTSFFFLKSDLAWKTFWSQRTF